MKTPQVFEKKGMQHDFDKFCSGTIFSSFNKDLKIQYFIAYPLSIKYLGLAAKMKVGLGNQNHMYIYFILTLNCSFHDL